MFIDNFEPTMTVEEKIELIHEKEKQINTLNYEKGLIECNIVDQMKTCWSVNPDYNIICGLVPDFWNDISGKYEDRKGDKKYLETLNWILEIVKRKLQLPQEVALNYTFHYKESMLFYGAGLGCKPCHVELIFSLHVVQYKPINIQISIPIYENVNIDDYKYELNGIQVHYSIDDSNIYELACYDVEYQQLANKFNDWMDTKLRCIAVKEEESE